MMEYPAGSSADGIWFPPRERGGGKMVGFEQQVVRFQPNVIGHTRPFPGGAQNSTRGKTRKRPPEWREHTPSVRYI